jgi:hypothetical protein
MSIVGISSTISCEESDTNYEKNQVSNKQYPPHRMSQEINKQYSSYVMNPEINKQYCLVFDKSHFIQNSSSCILPVKNRREVELFLLCLGQDVNVIMNEQMRKQHPDVWDWLYGHTYEEVFKDLKWSYREADEVLDIIERIPLPKNINESLIMTHCYLEPERINQEYVHKIHKDCVLISKPYQCGNRFYFNGFTKSPEFNIDHNSDHLQGILAFEVARQAVAATTHLAGIPLQGTIIILKSLIQYKNFIEPDEPFLIHTIPVLKQRGGYYYTVFNLIQNGNSCVIGYFNCFRYKSNEAYRKHKVSQYIQQS